MISPEAIFRSDRLVPVYRSDGPMPRFIWATDLHLDTASRAELDRFCSRHRRVLVGR